MRCKEYLKIFSTYIKQIFCPCLRLLAKYIIYLRYTINQQLYLKYENHCDKKNG